MGSMKKKFLDYLIITVGSVIIAISINIFLSPYKIAPGGVTGIATVIYHISKGKFPLGITMFAINAPLFFMGIKIIGTKFAFRSLYGTISLSLIIDIMQPFATSFSQKYLLMFDDVSSAPDLLLYSIFGGALMGVGLALVFRAGATTGGTDLAAAIVNRFMPTITIGQSLLFIDTVVIILAALFFHSVKLALYATVTLFISSKFIDIIIEGVNYAKAVLIISDKSDEIASKIMYELDRGVTALKGMGMYTRSEKQVLYCIIHRNEITRLKEIVKKVDTSAFVILTEVREVLGEGFKDYD
ncbi:MAG TPA: YitT family protein [Clostridiaceae bacterium]|nr:YitT family protein [Clostridiaceae bacterium]